jgi:hypothetical protein
MPRLRRPVTPMSRRAARSAGPEPRERVSVPVCDANVHLTTLVAREQRSRRDVLRRNRAFGHCGMEKPELLSARFPPRLETASAALWGVAKW